MANYSKYYMRKILFAILLAAISFGAMAQNAKNSINIDPSSFRPVQTDVLTGVNIDPIAKDRSQRECARIKLHVNRMTREEINQLQVHIVGGMVALTKKVIAYEGNGLILEMTAKPQTRFYLHHDKYGDSNEVMVNLEGNKEYFLDAQLDMLLPITVVSNIKGADVYVDGTYKGQTNDNYMLTVEDIVPGDHKIALKYGAATTEKLVDVNSSNISFRVEINSQSSQPQYVVFDLEPKTAIVFIDNEPQTTQDGVMSTVLQNGTYSYRVIAKGYYEQTGSFTIEGAKVVRKITLKADAAMVTISAAGEDVEIWANNELKGKSPWRGPLIAGTYIFEARKAGHRTTSLSQAITSTPAEQSYTLNAPTPIIGSVDITSTPALADVYIDGKHVGQTPMKSNLYEGNHTITIQKTGYAISEHSATVLEGKTTTVVAMLNKATEGDNVATTTTPVIAAPKVEYPSTTGPYKIGDFYNENGKEGVVFQVDSTGYNGRIISLTESATRLQWSSESAEQNNNRDFQAWHSTYGVINTTKVQQVYGWQNKFPAFKWCTDLGEGWYLPSIGELQSLLRFGIHNTINKTLSVYGTKLADIGTTNSYWSSTEEYKSEASSLSMLRGEKLRVNKSSSNYVRAVAVFGAAYEKEYKETVKEYQTNGIVEKGSNGLYGFRDKNNNLILPYEYDNIYVSDYLYTSKNGYEGVYDFNGNEIVPLIYNDIRVGQSEGVWAVKKYKKWGYIDNCGNKIIDLQYKDAKPFSEGLAAVKKGNKYGYINKQNQVVIPFEHKRADSFQNGLARVGKQAGWGWLLLCLCPIEIHVPLMVMPNEIKYGYIDKTGNIVIPKLYKGAPLEFDKNGLAEVYKTNSKKKFYIDKNNNPYKTYEEALLKTSGKK